MFVHFSEQFEKCHLQLVLYIFQFITGSNWQWQYRASHFGLKSNKLDKGQKYIYRTIPLGDGIKLILQIFVLIVFVCCIFICKLYMPYFKVLTSLFKFWSQQPALSPFLISLLWQYLCFFNCSISWNFWNTVTRPWSSLAGGPRMDRRVVTSPGVVNISPLASRSKCCICFQTLFVFSSFPPVFRQFLFSPVSRHFSFSLVPKHFLIFPVSRHFLFSPVSRDFFVLFPGTFLKGLEVGETPFLLFLHTFQRQMTSVQNCLVTNTGPRMTS